MYYMWETYNDHMFLTKKKTRKCWYTHPRQDLKTDGTTPSLSVLRRRWFFRLVSWRKSFSWKCNSHTPQLLGFHTLSLRWSADTQRARRSQSFGNVNTEMERFDTPLIFSNDLSVFVGAYPERHWNAAHLTIVDSYKEQSLKIFHNIN